MNINLIIRPKGICVTLKVFQNNENPIALCACGKHEINTKINRKNGNKFKVQGYEWHL